MEQFEKINQLQPMERFLGQTLDLANHGLIMILCDCLYKILKTSNTLTLISLCFNLITYTILGIIVFFYLNITKIVGKVSNFIKHLPFFKKILNHVNFNTYLNFIWRA